MEHMTQSVCKPVIIRIMPYVYSKKIWGKLRSVIHGFRLSIETMPSPPCNKSRCMYNVQNVMSK